MVALGRLSPNWLLSRISGGYVELVRNLPLLFQILFWYLAVLGGAARSRGRAFRCSAASFSPIAASWFRSRSPIPGSSRSCSRCWWRSWPSLLLRCYARRQLFDSGRLITDLALGAWPADRAAAARPRWCSARPSPSNFPLLKGFNFAGGAGRHSGIRRADAGAVDLHRGVHRRDRARRHPVGAQGADGGRLLARAVAAARPCG